MARPVMSEREPCVRRVGKVVLLVGKVFSG
jgi:hypothetical protein